MCGRRGSIADVVVPIEASQEEWLVWQFTLEQYDVGFQILENGVALKDSVRYIAAAVPTSEPPVQQQDPPSPLPPARISRCGSEELRVEAGMIRVKHGNVFTLRWDNTYSLVRRKHVRYRFVLVSKSKLALAERAACDNHEPDEDPLFPFLLPQPRTPSDKDTDMERNEAIDLLERSVTDVVSIFMTRPDSPLHEGSIRAFILAMEAVLRHGIKVKLVNDAVAWYWDLLVLISTRRIHSRELGPKNLTTHFCWKLRTCCVMIMASWQKFEPSHLQRTFNLSVGLKHAASCSWR